MNLDILKLVNNVIMKNTMNILIIITGIYFHRL